MFEKRPDQPANPEARVRAVVDAFMTAQNAHDLKAIEPLLLDSPQFLWITRNPDLGARRGFETI